MFNTIFRRVPYLITVDKVPFVFLIHLPIKVNSKDMNTKLVMIASAIVMGTIGVVLSFMPHEVLQYAGSDPASINPLILQLMGALYFSFAMINWTAKANLIGGIYGRPVAIGNLTHFIIGALALGKSYMASRMNVVLAPCIFYLIFAVLFGIIFFTHPVKNES